MVEKGAGTIYNGIDQAALVEDWVTNEPAGLGYGELWSYTWCRDLHHHPLFLCQGQGLEQGKQVAP